MAALPRIVPAIYLFFLTACATAPASGDDSRQPLVPAVAVEIPESWVETSDAYLGPQWAMLIMLALAGVR